MINTLKNVPKKLNDEEKALVVRAGFKLFYKRFDFKESPFKHFQVPFRKNQKELELMLLNNKKSFTKEDYELFYINLQESIKYYL